MKKVVLISCSKKKLTVKSKAQKLYISPMFRLNLKYSKLIKADKAYILSAKYGLLELNDEIEPYDITLNTMKVLDKKKWVIRVLSQLKQVEDIDNTEFVFLAGENYRKYLLRDIKHYTIPMQKLPFGKQLQFLSRSLNE